MNLKSLRPSLLCGLGSVLLLSATLAPAAPYATSLTNNAGTVSFRINEAGASVKIIGNNGALTNDLGVVPLGLTVTNVAGLNAGVFFVQVNKTGSGAPSQISVDTNIFNHFEAPRSVAVNRRPGSPYFGRIYVGNTRNLNTASGRTQGDGIYVLNADSSDAVGQGNTALTGGLEMVLQPTSTIYEKMPWRLRVGADDDMLYICNRSDFESNKVSLFRVDPNVSATSGTNVLKMLEGNARTGVGSPNPGVTSANNHGSILETIVTGSLTAGDLTVYTVDEDYETNPDVAFYSELNSLWRYDIGSADGGLSFPWSNPPNAKLVTPSISSVAQTMGLDRATNGYLYLLDSRSSGADNCLQVVDSAGTLLYQSRPASLDLGLPRDWFSNCVSVAVSPDMQYIAAMRANGIVLLVPLVDGIPNLAARTEFTTGTTANCRQIVFDAANNLYTISNTSERLRVFSLGRTTTAVTGSDGTFTLSSPSSTITITVDTDTVSEASPSPATFTLTRANDPLTAPLAVTFTMSGSATRGADYLLQTNGVTFTTNVVVIPAGVDTLTVTLVPTDDTVAELQETAVFTLNGSGSYSAGTPANATVSITDNETPAMDLTVVQASMYERLTNDYTRLRLVRRGDINAGPFDVNLTYGGIASASRFSGPATVTVNQGDTNVSFDISPLNDSLLQGNQTITATVAAGTGYTVGTNSPSASVTIVDDEVPAETVLYSENFNTDNSAAWTVKFGSGNGIDDYRYVFNYDYASGIAPVSGAPFPVLPPAPHSTADTTGVYLTANKDEATALGAAGVNIYPQGLNFSNNFAVRFDMYALVGNAASTTEHVMFGINHSGNNTNWFRSGGVPAGTVFDGLFYGVETDGAALGDYVIYSAPNVNNNPTALTPGVNATSFTGIFKVPPYGGNATAGAPGVWENSTTPSWSDVEISKIGRLITLKINNTTIMTYTNTTIFTNGTIMLGYVDSFDSVMAGNSAVIFDNLRVVALNLGISKFEKVGANFEVSFNWSIDDATNAFILQTATNVAGPYVDAAATITKLSPAAYKAVLPVAGDVQFYRVRYARP